MTQNDDSPPFDGLSRRLWTPWRMAYVGGGAKETGCIFCNRIGSDDDVASLILHRSARSVAIMNLYPYNTGHLMIVPIQHVASPEESDPADLADMATLLPPVLRALRRVLDCHGFNAGFNLGAVAGAGVAEHLHQHVVPRWTGDANFMPIIGAAMVIPELIPVSYAKIRAELQRELAGEPVDRVTAVVVDPHSARVLVEVDGALPVVQLQDDLSIWRSVIDQFALRGLSLEVAGWAGTNRAGTDIDLALSLLATEAPEESGRWLGLNDLSTVDSPVRTIIDRALAQLSPIITSRHIRN